MVFLAFASSVTFAGEAVDAIRKAAKEQAEAADTDASFKKVELAKKYVVALNNLEKKLTGDGNLDAIVHLREERAAVEKSGSTTAHQDKALVELREKYVKSISDIDAGLKSTRAKVSAGITAKIREQESALTKAGKVDDALALRKEGDRLLLEFTGGAADVPFEDDPRAAAASGLKSLEVVEIPKEKPPFYEKPFMIIDRWLESLTVPTSKQKVRTAVLIGDRAKKSWPLVVISPGSVWVADEKGRVELSAGNVVASKCRFEDLPLEADLACHFYFQNCAFADCRFQKGGVWYGSEQAGKFYFENCLVKGSFSKHLNVVDTGIRAETSVFEGIEFPPFLFKKKQPSDYQNHKWLRIYHCRFVKCTIPVSFLLLTRDCVFENCVFTDDPAKPADEGLITKPIEIVLYVKGCKSKITGLPGTVKLTEKPDTALKGVVIPTAAALTGMMEN